MTCFTNLKKGADFEKGAGILLDYCAGALTSDQTLEVERHAKECAECRDLIEAQRHVWQSLDTFTPLEISADFDQRLFARIAAGQKLSPARRWLNRIIDSIREAPVWKPALAGVGACAVLAAGLFVQTPNVIDSTASSTSNTASKPASNAASNNAADVDINQVERTLEDLDLLAPSTRL